MIGCTVGLALGSGVAAVALAIAGLVAGHLYDDLHSEPIEPTEPGEPSDPRAPSLIGEQPTPPRALRAVPRAPHPAPVQAPAPEAFTELARALCPLFVELARVDGEVSREEVRAIREHFEQALRFDARALQTVRNQLKASIAAPTELDQACRAAREGLDPKQLPTLVDALYRVALADGALQRSEHDALRRICRDFGLEEAQAGIAQTHLGTGTEAFAALGLPADASNDEIRSAFRRLAAQHHPDRVAGAGPAAIADATQRFQQVKDAYEALRRLRGL